MPKSEIDLAEPRPPWHGLAYQTKKGTMYWGTIEDFLESDEAEALRGKVHLIFTSPPFPLNRKKRYGNKVGDAYKSWLSDLAEPLAKLLTPKGSIVMEMGNAWVTGKPFMSTLALEALLEFKTAGKLNLCERFVHVNPASLPAPIQWVNVERIRVKDAFTEIWWLSRHDKTYANNRRVLQEYSPAMKRLLQTGEYNSGKRPSEYNIGEDSFNKDNGGAIPPNVITKSNTSAFDRYLEFCRLHNLPIHPARMNADVADFFIRFLTKPGNFVLDPFGGSNLTGAVAEKLDRKWIAIEPQGAYTFGSMGRFALIDQVALDFDDAAGEAIPRKRPRKKFKPLEASDAEKANGLNKSKSATRAR